MKQTNKNLSIPWSRQRFLKEKTQARNRKEKNDESDTIKYKICCLLKDTIKRNKWQARPEESVHDIQVDI